MNKVLGLLAALLLSVLTLAYALWDVDLGALWGTLKSGDLWVLIPFTLILALFFTMNAIRWILMLRPFGHYSVLEAAAPMMIGFAGNYVLPFRVGEIIRAYLFATEHHCSKSGILMTLVLERFLDLSAILILYILGLEWLEWREPGSIPAGFQASGWLAALVLLGILTTIVAFLFFPNRVNRIWNIASELLPAALAVRGTTYLRELERGLSSLRKPGIALALAAESLLRWSLAAVLVWLALSAYGPSPSFALSMVVVGVTAVAVSIPSAPGFVGPMQAAFVLALTPFGVSQEIALSASILFLLGHFVPVVAAGGWFFFSRHLSFAQLRREIEAQE